MKKSSNYVLIVGFSIILLLLFASSAIGLKNMSDINLRMEAMVRNRIVKADILQTMRNFARERSISLLRIVIKEDPFELDEEIQHFSLQAGHWIQTKDKLMTFGMDAKVREMLEILFKMGGEVAKQQRVVIALIDQEKRSEARDLLIEKVIPGQDEVIKYYEKVLGYQQKLSQQEVDDAETAYDEAFRFLTLISIILMILGMAIAIYVVRQNNRAEAKLREEIQRQQNLQLELTDTQDSLLKAQEIAQIGNWNWDIESNKLRFSDQIYRIFGISKQQWGIGYDDFFKAVHPEDRLLRKNTIAKVLEELPEQYSVEYRILRPNGSICYLAETGKLIFDPVTKKNPIGIIATVQDISERKSFETELARSTREEEIIGSLLYHSLNFDNLEDFLDNSLSTLIGNSF